MVQTLTFKLYKRVQCLKTQMFSQFKPSKCIYFIKQCGYAGKKPKLRKLYIEDDFMHTVVISDLWREIFSFDNLC